MLFPRFNNNTDSTILLMLAKATEPEKPIQVIKVNPGKKQCNTIIRNI